MPPRTGLSGNTLSLKFMNRGNPSPATSSKPTTTAPAPAKPSTSRSIANNSQDGEWFIPGWEDPAPAPSAGTSSSRTWQTKEDKIEVEDSYLPFLLEKDTASRTPSIGGGAEAGKVDIGGKGGRRSFGGINKSIERLSQPTTSLVSTPEQSSPNTPASSSTMPTPQRTTSTDAQTGFLRPSGFTSPPSKRKAEKTVLSHLQPSAGARRSASGIKRFPPLSKKKRKSDTISSSASGSDDDDDDDDDDDEEEEEQELQMLYDSVAPAGARGSSKGKPRTGGISSGGGGGGARRPQGQGKRAKKNGGSA